MKKNILVSIVAAFLSTMHVFAAGKAAADTTATKSDSWLFHQIKDDLGGLFSAPENLFNHMTSSFTYSFFLFIVLMCILSLAICIRNIVRKSAYSKGGTLHLMGKILPQLTVPVFIAGTAIYYLGFSHSGTGDNFFTIMLRSVLASFEMFLSKSSLIGVAGNCKNSEVYMFFFALTHVLAVMISMLFAVACFGKRILDWFRKKWWTMSHTDTLYVFWGINDKSINLANDIYFAKKKEEEEEKERIVFVDMPDDNENKNGRSFSGIMGLLSYNTGFAKKLAGIKYVLMKSETRPSALEGCNINFLNSMGLTSLHYIMKNAKNVNFFIFTDDSDANMRAALNMLDSDIAGKVKAIYCSARKNWTTNIHAECRIDKLHIIDDSREAVMELAMKGYEKRTLIAHPINFVDIDSSLGCVKKDKPFTAMVIGFNTTGQDAMKFIYEYSAFPDAEGNKVPVHIMAFDSRIEAIKGELYQEIPALPQIEQAEEIELCPYNTGTEKFYNKLHTVIDRLNYVVIATGDDDRNLQIAAMLYEFALQYRKNGFDKFKIFVRLYNSDNEFKFKKTIEAYDKANTPAIKYFGSPKSIYTKSWIVDKEEENHAEQFYRSYCKASEDKNKKKKLSNNDETKDRKKELINKENKTLSDYRKFNRTILQDISNYKHCYTKEILLGLHDKAGSLNIPKWPLNIDGFGNGEEKTWRTKLLNASICEHLRWNASHLMMGYVTMPAEDMKNDNSCDERTKRHICIVDWDELKKLSSSTDYQMYDYYVVKTTMKIYAQKNNMKTNYEE